jgi:hypothetical protein
MANALAQVVMQGTSNLPEDVYVNTFHFRTAGADVTTADADAIQTALLNFYVVIHAPGTSPLCNEISDTVSRGATATKTKVYDLGDPTPRLPVKTYAWQMGPGIGSVGLPNEVAICLSYSADVASGENPRRRRGRLYIGPLASTHISGVGGDVIPSATMVNALLGAGKALKDDATVDWCVYSRADDTLYTITHGFVDNAFDTQRRRGRVAQTRSLWT